MNVREAAIALFNQEWKDFQDNPNTKWRQKVTLLTYIYFHDVAATFLNCYFHAENAVMDLSEDMAGDIGWARFPYSDPAFPNNLIELLYRRALRYVRRFSHNIPLFEKVEQTLNLLIAKHKHLHMGCYDRDTSILEVSGD